MKSYTLIINLNLIILLFILKPTPTKPDPNDSFCLTQLHSSFQNPNLQNWSTSFFTNPCYNGYDSHMVGLTCNNGRIYRISLPNMSLHGTISFSITKCTNLQTLDLSSNFLSGNIPTNINDLTNLAVLNLSYNKLSGNIPQTLYLCAYLNIISLQHNQLTGPIPQQLGLLARLNTFDVSYNELEGMIPSSLGNRSGNGNLARFNASDFQGNKGLYGYPLEEYSRKDNNRTLSIGEIVGIGLGSGFLSLVLSFTIVCVWLKVSEFKLAAAEHAKINSHHMPDY